VVGECDCILLVLIGEWSEDEEEVEVGKECIWGCVILRRKLWIGYACKFRECWEGIF